MRKYFQKTDDKAKDPMAKANTAEPCVLCGEKTEYSRETPVDQRIGYIEGAGQLCRMCYVNTFQKNVR